MDIGQWAELSLEARGDEENTREEVVVSMSVPLGFILGCLVRRADDFALVAGETCPSYMLTNVTGFAGRRN